MSEWYDPRYGQVFPPSNCNSPPAGKRVALKLDFGRGYVWVTPWQSGCATPLLRAVLSIKEWREGEDHDPYHVVSCGAEACRDKRTGSDPSMHCFPIAIDLNCNTNSLGGGRGDMPSQIINAFEDEGFQWGGDWGDPMHFQRTHWYGLWNGQYPQPEPSFRQLVIVHHGADQQGRKFKTLDHADKYMTGIVRADWDAENIPDSRRHVVVSYKNKNHDYGKIALAINKAKALLNADWQHVENTGEKAIATVKLFDTNHPAVKLSSSTIVLRRQKI